MVKFIENSWQALDYLTLLTKWKLVIQRQLTMLAIVEPTNDGGSLRPRTGNTECVSQAIADATTLKRSIVEVNGRISSDSPAWRFQSFDLDVRRVTHGDGQKRQFIVSSELAINCLEHYLPTSLKMITALLRWSLLCCVDCMVHAKVNHYRKTLSFLSIT